MELTAPAIWLRDNCSCAECRHAGSGQKLMGVDEFAGDLRVAEIRQVDDEVRVRFVADPHEAVFDRSWLAEFWPADDAGPPADDRTEDAKTTWSVAELSAIPEFDATAYSADPAVRLAALEAVLELGFVVLHGVQPRAGAVLTVARSFGFVRTTNYGELFDVRVEADPNNLAFTSLPIAPHTDNPYRDPVPTLQLLHCLTNAANGGDSGLVDGFRAAALLRAENPAAFAVLTSTAVTFAFASEDTRLRATRPMIGLDSYGRIREIRFNNRSLKPVRHRAEDTERFYAAYRAFTDIVNRPELRLVLRMRPGDCIMFDNTRLLHARTAFDSLGDRHLQGCYAEIDGLASTVAVLRGSNS
jgi:gamma-butyrobetaine hydroxylase